MINISLQPKSKAIPNPATKNDESEAKYIVVENYNNKKLLNSGKIIWERRFEAWTCCGHVSGLTVGGGRWGRPCDDVTFLTNFIFFGFFCARLGLFHGRRIEFKFGAFLQNRPISFVLLRQCMAELTVPGQHSNFNLKAKAVRQSFHHQACLGIRPLENQLCSSVLRPPKSPGAT